jgi:hypothetical protein
MVYDGAGNRHTECLPKLPEYEDLKPKESQKGSLTETPPTATSSIMSIPNAAIHQSPLLSLNLLSFLRDVPRDHQRFPTRGET